MSPTRLRTLLRWSHIAVGALIGGYVCSPLHLDPTATLIARLSLLPLVGLSGAAMWQQGRITRVFRKSGSAGRLAQAGS
jgi:hypothetical protein